MFEGLAHICQVTGVAELIVASAGFIIVALVAVWRKLSSSPPSSAELPAEQNGSGSSTGKRRFVASVPKCIRNVSLTVSVDATVFSVRFPSACLTRGICANNTASCAALAKISEPSRHHDDQITRASRNQRARRYQLTIEAAVARKQSEDDNPFRLTRISEHERPAVNGELLDIFGMRKFDV